MKQIPFEAHHSFTSQRLTAISRSFLLPSSMKEALGTLLLAISYQTALMLSQLLGFDMSNTSTTPSQDLKYVATMHLNFSCPAVSQMQSLTCFSCTCIFLYLKSMVVTSRSVSASLLMYLQKMEDLPVPASPIKMILYLSSPGAQFSIDILVINIFMYNQPPRFEQYSYYRTQSTGPSPSGGP